MSAPLSVAVVGAGVMGRYHALNYGAMPGVKLVAMVDVDAERRQQMADSYGCRTYATVAELVANEQVDAASVAVPTSLHYPVARALLEAGAHVLIEKPVATDVAQALALKELSGERGLVLQVGHITRFYETVRMLSRQVDRPYLIEARRFVASGRVRDVGVVLDLMIHDIDIVLRLLKGQPVEVSVSGHYFGDSEHEDVAAAQVLFDDGCIARLLASRVSPDSERTLLVAEKGQTIRVDFAKEPYAEVLVFRSPRSRTTAGHVKLDRHEVHEENPLRKELEHFVARIRKSAVPIGTLDDDIRSLDLATRILDELRLVAAREQAAGHGEPAAGAALASTLHGS